MREERREAVKGVYRMARLAAGRGRIFSALIALRYLVFRRTGSFRIYQ